MAAGGSMIMANLIVRSRHAGWHFGSRSESEPLQRQQLQAQTAAASEGTQTQEPNQHQRHCNPAPVLQDFQAYRPRDASADAGPIWTKAAGVGGGRGRGYSVGVRVQRQTLVSTVETLASTARQRQLARGSAVTV